MNNDQNENLWWLKSMGLNSNYNKNATMILVGSRGVGKSTLAVICAMALKRRFVDLITTFETLAGISSEAFRAKYGTQELLKKEAELLQSILLHNPTNCVVATSSSSVKEPCYSILMQYVTKMPIVYVTRSQDEVSDYLKPHDDHDRLLHLAVERAPLYRLCSTFEFVNLGLRYITDDDVAATSRFATPKLKRSPPLGLGDGQSIVIDHPTSPILSGPPLIPIGLKRLERDFLTFLDYIYGDNEATNANGNSNSPRNGNANGDGGTTPSPSTTLSTWNPLSSKSNLHIYSHSLLLPFFDITLADIDLEDVSVGVDALEIRVDLFAVSALTQNQNVLTYVANQIAFIRRFSNLPIIYNFSKSIFTANPENLNINTQGNPDFWIELYIELLFFSLRLNVDYTTVWLELLPERVIQSLILKKRSTKIIGCVTTSVWESTKLYKQISLGYNIGCDIIKITSYALTIKDNFNLLSALNEVTNNNSTATPNTIIAYNNGPLGKMSRCFNSLLSPVDHALLWAHPDSFYSLSDKNPLLGEFSNKRENILTIQEAHQSLYSAFLLPKQNFYRLGQDLHSTKAHLVYQKSLDYIGLPHEFHVKEISNASQVQEVFSSPEFGGAVISWPLKVSIMSQLSSVSTYARIIGACNVVISVRDPQSFHPIALHGENTDWKGILASIAKNLTTRNSITPSTTAVIIGAGGTARASVFALICLGVRNIFVYNRTRENAEKLVAQFEGEYGNPSSSPTTTAATPVPPVPPTGVSKIGVASTTVWSMRYITRKNSLLKPDTTRPKNFGSLSFETENSENPITSIGIIDSLTEEWPKDITAPTIIINCTPVSTYELPNSWLSSPNGGLGLDVSIMDYAKV